MIDDAGPPPFKNSSSTPFVYFDIVPTFGVLHGVIQLELAAHTLSPNGTNVTVEIVPCARLRCSLAAAEHLLNAVQKSIEMLSKPQNITSAASPKLQ